MWEPQIRSAVALFPDHFSFLFPIEFSAEFEGDPFWTSKEGKINPLPHTKHSSLIAEHKPKLHSYVELDKEGLKKIGSVKGPKRLKK